MPKLTWLFALVVLVSSALNAAEFADIKRYLISEFPSDFYVSDLQVQQLVWATNHRNASSEMAVQTTKQSVHIEVTRALNRLYCLQLLKSGTRTAYDKFIKAQLVKNIECPLNYVSFHKLSKQIKNLSAQDYALIQDAIIISAISMSGQATDLAQQQLTVLPNESLEFIATTLRLDANMYPLVKTNSLLYVIFPPHTNFRHMLYTEGGTGMFVHLRSMIKQRYINQQKLDMWYAYWIVNIAGFRGHIISDGSLYLNEQVFQAMDHLKKLLDQMLTQPNFDPLQPYLEYRAGLLGFSDLPNNEKLALSHLASMMRIYDSKQGRCLRQAYLALSKQQQQDFSEHFNKLLTDPLQEYPSFAPALFANILVLNKQDIPQALQIVIPVYLDAQKLFQTAKRKGNIAPQIRLSFNSISSATNLKYLLKTAHLGKPKCYVDAEGELRLKSE